MISYIKMFLMDAADGSRVCTGRTLNVVKTKTMPFQTMIFQNCLIFKPGTDYLHSIIHSHWKRGMVNLDKGHFFFSMELLCRVSVIKNRCQLYLVVREKCPSETQKTQVLMQKKVIMLYRKWYFFSVVFPHSD